MTEQDAKRYRFLTSLQERCAVYLEHNDFAASYRTAKQELEEDVLGTYSDVLDEIRAKMIEANSIWSLQIYPNTPVGFNIYHGSTLDDVIELAMEDG